MKRSNALFIFGLIIIACVTAWALLKYGEKDRREVIKNTNTEMMIERKELSNHNAEFYEEVGK